LPLHVFGAHVHVTGEAEDGRRGGRGHPMLPGSRLRDDPALAHADCEKHLSDRVVDLVGARVQQVFALQVDARAPARFAEPPREVERGRATAELRQIPPPLGGERHVAAGVGIGSLQLIERGDQRLRHVSPAVCAEPAAGASGHDKLGSHHRTSAVFHFCTWATNARIFAGSVRPSVSTPLATSTAYGSAACIASPTFSGVSPPDRMTGPASLARATSVQSNARPVPPISPGTCASSRNAATWYRPRSRTLSGPRTLIPLIT